MNKSTSKKSPAKKSPARLSAFEQAKRELQKCILAKAKADGVSSVTITLSRDRKNLTVTYLKRRASKEELIAENGLVCRYINECLRNSPLRNEVECRKVKGRSQPPGSGGEAAADPPPGGGGGCNCTPR